MILLIFLPHFTPTVHFLFLILTSNIKVFYNIVQYLVYFSSTIRFLSDLTLLLSTHPAGFEVSDRFLNATNKSITQIWELFLSLCLVKPQHRTKKLCRNTVRSVERACGNSFSTILDVCGSQSRQQAETAFQRSSSLKIIFPTPCCCQELTKHRNGSFFPPWHMHF